MIEEFRAAGIEVVAASANDREVAAETASEWGLENLPLGYGVTMEDAERWGLFASTARKDNEPDLFVEPATFVVRADGTLYASIVQTMPFTRPPFAGLLSSLKWIIEQGYPARGEARPWAAS